MIDRLSLPAANYPKTTTVDLNRRAAALVAALVDQREALGVSVQTAPTGCQLIDCGIKVSGGLETGRLLSEICLSGLGKVSFVPASADLGGGIAVAVTTDAPVAACMASQYAGWQVSAGKYFAMASGPMRAAAGKEKLFDTIGHRERPEVAVGILEARGFPPDEVCQDLAKACGVPPERLTLLAAPTASLAGMVQVVARSVETALHKLFELGFDLSRVQSGWGVAPLPPAASDDLTAIGLTNDCILYGAEVTLWVRGDDASLEAIGPKVPSCASRDYGRPFAAIFEHYERDFYKIDPHLFSPAVVTLANLDTGTSLRYGRVQDEVLRRSISLRHAGG